MSDVMNEEGLAEIERLNAPREAPEALAVTVEVNQAAADEIDRRNTDWDNTSWVDIPTSDLDVQAEEGLPAGGLANQVLMKTADTDYAYEWHDPAVSTGGAPGQMLAKASPSDYDTTWVDPSGGGDVPPGGVTGQTLTKTGSADYATGWTTPPKSVPAGGGTGQVLTKQSATDFDFDWADAPSGGGGGGTAPGPWTNLSLPAGWSVVTGVWQYRLNNGRVEMRGAIQATAGATTSFPALPAEARPARQTFALAAYDPSTGTQIQNPPAVMFWILNSGAWGFDNRTMIANDIVAFDSFSYSL